jgi:GT2 family glycosyltransferase
MNSISNLPWISIVIPNHNGSRFLEKCLNSLCSQTYERMEIVLVDNHSSDESVLLARRVAPEAILVQKDRNLGFAGGVNAGIRSSRGDWVAVLNNDTEVAPDWLAECARAVQNHPDASFLACRILNFADRHRIYSAGDCFLRAGIGYRRGQDQPDREDFGRECEIFSASGCAGLYRRDALESGDGFDERFFAYLEDVDLGLRLQAKGCRGYYVPSAMVYHHGAGTSGGEFSPLAVRLRTRNSLLLLLKSLPGTVLVRCLPMIFLAQLSWLFRVIKHRQLINYIRGLANTLPLAPAMFRERAKMRPYWRNSGNRFWCSILQSESLARKEYMSVSAKNESLFLKWYFRLF